MLSHHFLKKYAAANKKTITEICPLAMQRLRALDYPGNVRELENIIERGVIFCRTESLKTADLSLDPAQEPLDPPYALPASLRNLGFKDAKEEMTAIFHRHYIDHLLREHNGNVSLAAQKAGIQRQYLHRLMKEAGLVTNGYRDRPNGETDIPDMAPPAGAADEVRERQGRTINRT